MAHRGHKLQLEIVAVLGLLALFTHTHIFWVAGLLLALIDLSDFTRPMRRIAGSAEKIAGLPPGTGDTAEDQPSTYDVGEEQARTHDAVRERPPAPELLHERREV